MHPWVGLSDHVRLGAVPRWVTPELAAEALDDCGVRDKKPGALPARFMVCFTLALALFQQDLLRRRGRAHGRRRPGIRREHPGQVLVHPGSPAPGSTGHRDGLPHADRAAGPCCGLKGSFYRGMRLAAVDGFVLDAPETEANRRRLGGPKDARGQVAGFRQVRVVTLTETGTPAQIDAAASGGACPPHLIGARAPAIPAPGDRHAVWARRPGSSGPAEVTLVPCPATR